jgi:hypothetical protein
MTVIYNFVVIPLIITKAAEFESHKSESGKQMSIFYRCFFYMLITALFMPMMGLPSMKEVFTNSFDTNIVHLPYLLAGSMLDQYDVFIVFFI